MKRQSVLLNYFLKNRKNYIIIFILFFIGIVLGVFFINNANSVQVQEITEYVSKLTNNIKNYENINKTDLLVESIKQNILFLIIIWFLGCTIIGSFFIFIAIVYRGFTLGYTISAMIASLGVKKGSIFVLSSLLIQNIVFLPAFFMLAESGIRLYKIISKHCINLKTEVIRHSLIMLISLFLAIVSSFIEVYLSTNLLLLFNAFY